MRCTLEGVSLQLGRGDSRVHLVLGRKKKDDLLSVTDPGMLQTALQAATILVGMTSENKIWRQSQLPNRPPIW